METGRTAVGRLGADSRRRKFLAAPAQSAGFTASPALPWTDAGGTITLAEPLTLDELRTGALVLRVRRDGAAAVDAVGVAQYRESDQSLVGVDFYAYGSKVAQTGNGTDYQAGVFVISWSDRGYQWEVVGVRIDKQFWHGGTIDEGLTFDNAAGTPLTDGEQAAAFGSVLLDSEGTESSQLAVSFALSSDSPLGGEYVADAGRIRIYDGNSSISDGVTFNKAAFTHNRPLVKCVPMLIGTAVALKILYPTDGSWAAAFALLHSDGTEVTSLSQPGPFLLQEI